MMADSDAFLHLAKPLGPADARTQPNTAPLNVVIQPQVSDLEVHGSSFGLLLC